MAPLRFVLFGAALVLSWVAPAGAYIEVYRQGYTLPDFGGTPMKYCFLLLGMNHDQVLLIWDGGNTLYGDFNRDKTIDAVAEKRVLSSDWPPVQIAQITASDGRTYRLNSYLPYGQVMMRTETVIPGWSATCVWGTLNGGAYNHIRTWGADLKSAGVEWQGGPVKRLWPRDRPRASWAPYDALAGETVGWPQYPTTEYGANCYSAANYCPGYHPVWGPDMVLRLPGGDLVSKMNNFCACGGAIGATAVTIPTDTPTGAYEVTTDLAFNDPGSPDYAYRDYWDRYQGSSGTVTGYLLVKNNSGLKQAPPVIADLSATCMGRGLFKYPTIAVRFTTQTLTTARIKYGILNVDENEAVFDTWYEKQHEHFLWDLQWRTTYVYQVIARDFAGQETASPIGEFTVVGMPGDVNGDNDVDVFDVIDVIKAFGSMPGAPNWNPGADFNGSGSIDVFDVIEVVKNFGAGS